MSYCVCKTPHPFTDPRSEDSCTICGKLISPEWNTVNIHALLDRLKDIPEIRLSEDFDGFRAFCIGREEDGRQHFGYRYLGRNNERDAQEELGDCANYALMGVLRRRRENRDEHEDLAFTAIYHAFKAYEAISEIERKERGAP